MTNLFNIVNPDVLVIVLLTIILSLITYKIIKDKQKGKTCGSCSGCASVHEFRQAVDDIKKELCTCNTNND